MKTVPVSLNELKVQGITIGRRDTHGTEQVVFDLAELIDVYGEGSAVLMVKRPGDETAYPAATDQEDGKLLWTVSDIDTAYKGKGECEIFWYVNGNLAKTVIYPTNVLRDIGETTEEPPDAYPTWVDHLTELSAETLENARKAAKSAEEADLAAKDAGKAADDAEEAADESERQAGISGEHATDAEAWAVGKRGGVDVESTDETYQNNAKYYAGEADRISRDNAELAESWAIGGTGKRQGEDTNNAKYFSEESERLGQEKAKLAESWAVGGTGTRPGEDENNAEYWSEQAKQGASEQGWVHFYIDEAGHLHYVKTENAALSFYIDAAGHLHVTNA